MTGKPIPPPPGFRGPLSPMTGKPIPPPARPAPGSPGGRRELATWAGSTPRPVPAKAGGRTLAPEARPSYRAAPPAGRGRGPGKVARLLPAVARWLLEAARPGRADRCHVPVLRRYRWPAAKFWCWPRPALRSPRRAGWPSKPFGCSRDAPRWPAARLAAHAPARFLAAPTRPTAPPLRAARPTEERQARVRRREVAGAQVVVPAEARVDAAAGAARAGGGAHALTGKSYRPRHRRHMWPLTPPCLRVKSSSNGVPRPKSWRRG